MVSGTGSLVARGTAGRYGARCSAAFLEVARFRLDELGPYRVDVQFTLGGWQEYGGQYDYRLSLDDTQIAESTVDVGGQQTHHFSQRSELAAGEHTVRLTTLAIKPDSTGK